MNFKERERVREEKVSREGEVGETFWVSGGGQGRGVRVYGVEVAEYGSARCSVGVSIWRGAVRGRRG